MPIINEFPLSPKGTLPFFALLCDIGAGPLNISYHHLEQCLALSIEGAGGTLKVKGASLPEPTVPSFLLAPAVYSS